MNLDQIKNIIDVLLGPNDEERNEAYQIIESQKDDINFSILLSQLTISDQISSTQRLLCLIIYRRMNVKFPPELFPAFLPLFNTDDIKVSNQLAYLLSMKLKTEEQMTNLLESTSNESLTYLYGVFNLLSEYFFSYNNHLCDDLVIIFCTNFISQTQEASFSESDFNFIITIRGLATKVIDLIEAPYEQTEPDPESIPLLTLLLSLPITNELNIPVIQNILRSSLQNLPPTDFFNICYKHLSDLSEIAPLPSSLIPIASKIIWYSFFCYKYQIDEDIDDIDTTEFASFAIQLCILSDETIDRWRMNINDFFIEYINPDSEINKYSDDDEDEEFDDNDRDYNFVVLRKNCLNIANSKLFNETINICNEIMRISPYHMETAFYFLSNIIPTDYPEKFDLPIPDDEDSILYGQYIYTIASLNEEIDGGIIDECLEKDDDHLNLLVAKAICNTYSKTFIDRVVPVTMRLFNMSFMLESNECSSFLEFITTLIKKDPISFQPYIESIVEMLFEILKGVLSNRLATIEVIRILSVFCNEPDFTEFILDSTFPFIFDLFDSENSYLVLIGLDFLAALVSPLENSLLPMEIIQPVFEKFIENITNSLPSNNEEDEENKFIFSESMDSIMTSLAFFARSFSPSPFTPIICQWFVNAFDCIRKSDFSYLPSCIVHLFLNISEHEHDVELMKFLFNSVMNDDMIEEETNHRFKYSVALSLCSLLLNDGDYYLKCIEECEIDIRIFLPLIPIIMDEEDDHDVHFIDDLILIATMFKFGELIVLDHEEEKPLNSVALRTFFASFYHWFYEDDLEEKGLDALVQEYIADKRTYFNKDDPFFLNHPFRSMNSLIEFMNEFLPPLDQLPQTWQPNAQKILSYRVQK